MQSTSLKVSRIFFITGTSLLIRLTNINFFSLEFVSRQRHGWAVQLLFLKLLCVFSAGLCCCCVVCVVCVGVTTCTHVHACAQEHTQEKKTGKKNLHHDSHVDSSAALTAKFLESFYGQLVSQLFFTGFFSSVSLNLFFHTCLCYLFSCTIFCTTCGTAFQDHIENPSINPRGFLESILALSCQGCEKKRFWNQLFRAGAGCIKKSTKNSDRKSDRNFKTTFQDSEILEY